MFDALKKLSPAFCFWVLLIVALLVTMAGLGARELGSGDETRVAGISAEMFIDGNYVEPHLNGKSFLEYPPLYYWIDTVAFQMFGVTDGAAKLPSALGALGSALVIFCWALKLGMPPAGALCAGVMLLTSAQFFSCARRCMVDMLLAFFIVWSVYLYYSMLHAVSKWRKTGYFFGFALALCGGMFTKGLVGLAMPLAALGSFLVLADLREKKFRFSRYFLLGFGSLLGLGGVGVWCWMLYQRSGDEALHTVVWVNNFGRFSGSQGDHVEPFWYYLEKLPTLFQPYLIILPFALWGVWRKFREKTLATDVLLVLCFLLVPFVMLSLAAGKRQIYLLPLFAPCALLCAWYLWMAMPRLAFLYRLPQRWWARIGYIVAGLAGCFLTVLACIGQGWEIIWPLAALTLGVCFFLNQTRIKVMLASGVFAYGLLFVSLDTAVFGHGKFEESLRGLFEDCRAVELSGRRVVLVNAPERTRGAAVFYLGKRLPELEVEELLPPVGEVWIVRARRQSLKGLQYEDYHFLIGDLPADAGKNALIAR